MNHRSNCNWPFYTANLVVALLLLGLHGRVEADAGAESKEESDRTLDAGSVYFKTDDDVQIHGLYSPGKEKGLGAVLLHMAGRTGQDWKRFGERLGKNGIHALAIDLRGHGKSTEFSEGRTVTYDQLKEEDFKLMNNDVAAAVKFLRTQTTADPEKIVLIGASLGANLAIRYAADDPLISNVMLLSPGLEYKWVASEDAVQRYGARALFIAVSREDNFSAKSSLVLNAMCVGKKYLQIYTGAGHGTRMMSREPGLEPLLYGWMYGTLSSEENESLDVRPPTRPAPQ